MARVSDSVNNLIQCIFLDNIDLLSEQARRDFGFHKCKTSEEASVLFGVYVAMNKYMGVRERILSKYLARGRIGSLVDKYNARRPTRYYKMFKQLGIELNRRPKFSNKYRLILRRVYAPT